MEGSTIKIKIEQFNAEVNGVDEADAWAGVEAFLARQFTTNGVLDQAGYDAALAVAQADEARKASEAEAGLGARAWYEANPNAGLLFTSTILQLEAEIGTLIDQVLPLATAGQRTKMKLLLMTLAVTDRVLAKREGFVG